MSILGLQSRNWERCCFLGRFRIYRSNYGKDEDMIKNDK